LLCIGCGESDGCSSCCCCCRLLCSKAVGVRWPHHCAVGPWEWHEHGDLTICGHGHRPCCRRCCCCRRCWVHRPGEGQSSIPRPSHELGGIGGVIASELAFGVLPWRPLSTAASNVMLPWLQRFPTFGAMRQLCAMTSFLATASDVWWGTVVDFQSPKLGEAAIAPWIRAVKSFWVKPGLSWFRSAWLVTIHAGWCPI